MTGRLNLGSSPLTFRSVDGKIEGRNLIIDIDRSGLKLKDFDKVDESVIGIGAFLHDPLETGVGQFGWDFPLSNLDNQLSDENSFLITAGF